jgi:hypothetical protein
VSRLCVLLLPGLLQGCDPDGYGRPATDPSGADSLGWPVVAIEPPAPGAGEDLAALILVAAESGRDGTIRYRASWLRDGSPVDALDGFDTVPAEHTEVGEVWTLELVATIDGLVSEPATDSVTIGNSAPSVSVGLSPAWPVTDDDLDALVSAVDPDGDALELAYRWYLDGFLTSQDGPTLPAEATAREDTWLLQVVATDPWGASAESWTELTIANSAPSLLGAVISPQVFSVVDSPVCVAVGFEDADGDAPAHGYAWFVDGARLDGLGDADLDASDLARGQLVRCEITAGDDALVGNTVSSDEVAVGNAPPGSPGVGIFPLAPGAGSFLEAVITAHAEDPDGDPVSYGIAWTVDGTWYGDETTVPGEDVQAGQVWELSVTPSDGDLEGEPGVASVTIAG